MIQGKLHEILFSKDDVFGRLLERTENLDTDQVTFRPSEGEWTVAEVLEHLSIVEPRMVRLMERLLAKTEAGPVSDPTRRDQTITLESVGERMEAERFMAHPKHHPTSQITHSESLEILQQVHDDLHGFVPRFVEVDLSRLTFPHWIFGELTLGQWIAFLVTHEQKHLGQIESICERYQVENRQESQKDNPAINNQPPRR